ncbi:unnamed protein product [Owenia fusiformis]|uniref:Uncharacterized protein n=1 Tax=Owenia fusiformis TaxID=6347 RepID=A0A8J1T5I2_OWEFU|nr:unnamed protein product [Owenia fusiformis]
MASSRSYNFGARPQASSQSEELPSNHRAAGEITFQVDDTTKSPVRLLSQKSRDSDWENIIDQQERLCEDSTEVFEKEHGQFENGHAQLETVKEGATMSEGAVDGTNVDDGSNSQAIVTEEIVTPQKAEKPESEIHFPEPDSQNEQNTSGDSESLPSAEKDALKRLSDVIDNQESELTIDKLDLTIDIGTAQTDRVEKTIESPKERASLTTPPVSPPKESPTQKPVDESFEERAIDVPIEAITQITNQPAPLAEREKTPETITENEVYSPSVDHSSSDIVFPDTPELRYKATNPTSPIRVSDSVRPMSMASPTSTSTPSNKYNYQLSPEQTPMKSQPQPGTSRSLPRSGPQSPMSLESFDSAIARSHRSSVDSGHSSDPSRHHGHFVIVAIDFGTTYSGYAFSFTRDPESIHMMRKWEGGDPGVINQKTPTSLLLDPQGKFHSFGFSARDFFHDLDPGEARKWMYFEKFKMALHYNADLNTETTIKASNGKLVPALTIFSYALRFFREHALQELSDQSSTKILNEDVRWVITVPAIWKAEAKQFMREAAYKAGIGSKDFPDQLLIALEPEAASIYCRRLKMHQLVPEGTLKRPLSSKEESPEPMNMDQISDDFYQESHSPYISPKYPIPSTAPTVDAAVVGMRYMVVDCGGGTVDITVHELDFNTKLKELYKATGGPFGSVGVDVEFEKLLIGIFGQEFIQQFKYKRPAGYVDLMIAFESRKRAATPYKLNPLNVSLPFSFIDYYKKYKSGRLSTKQFGSQVESAIRKYGDKDIRWSSQGMLRLSPDAMKKLFLPTLERIKQAIGNVLNHPDCKDIRYMFLVGGFAESPLLQYELKHEFEHLLKIIIPQDVGLTILKGAVLFGMDPGVVSVRRSRMTYGVGVLNRFNKDKHPKDKKISKDGTDWCTDVFDKFVKCDQSVGLGDTVLRCYTPAKPGQKSSVINIYSTDKDNVKFITDPSVKKCGTLVLDLEEDQYATLPRRREIQTRMIFGGTEIKVSALDVATGKCVKSSIDFLNKQN